MLIGAKGRKQERGRTAEAYKCVERPLKWPCPECPERFSRKDDRDAHQEVKQHGARFHVVAKP